MREKLACSESQRDDFLSPAKSMSMTKQEDAAMNQQVASNIASLCKSASKSHQCNISRLSGLRRQFDPVRRQASADIYGGAESTTPATQIEPVYGGAESDTPATQIEPDVLKVSRLPRKMQRRQFDPVRRQASADIYGGAESTTPATQIEPDALKASRLPRKMQRRR